MMTTHVLTTPRFGTIEYTEQDIVSFGRGLVGFSNLKGFLILQHKEGSPFRWLQSLEDASLAFLIVEPGHFLADFCLDVPDSAVDHLELSAETAVLVYTMVNIPPGAPEKMTLNLAGPIVINAETQRAIQLVLEDDRYSVKHRVFPEERAA